MVAHQRGYLTAAIVGSQFVASELMKLPRMISWLLSSRVRSGPPDAPPLTDSEAILRDIERLGVLIKPYCIDVDAFRKHIASGIYPHDYAAGPIDEGGAREQKLLEYFVSLDLLDIRPTDIVIDVASEWSIFPEVVRRLTGATVYQQDLIFKPGLHGTYIGGSAAAMPIPDEFADKLVLHNAFEHFEGDADSRFILEAWRILKPGGILSIVPLFITDYYAILTDPFVSHRGIQWDEGARVVELPWWHNRFGRSYDVPALQRRVLIPGRRFETTFYYTVNLNQVHTQTYLHFSLVMQKPVKSSKDGA